MKEKIQSLLKNKKTYYFAFLAILIYLAFLFYADSRHFYLALKKTNLLYLPLLLFLALIAHLFVFLRWHFLLKKLGLSLPFKNRLRIYFSSWAIFFAPAKSGELIKCFFLKKLHQVPYRQSAPLVFIENFTDLIVILLFSLSGLYLFKIFPADKIFLIILVTVILILSFFIIFSFKGLAVKIFSLLKKLSFLKKRVEAFEHMYLTANHLLRPKILFVCLFLGFGVWLSFSLILYLLLSAFGIKLAFFAAVSVFCLATLVGFLSFVPSGLGTLEVSAFFFLTNQGVPRSIAFISPILLRLFTLWLGVIIGLYALWSLNKELPDHHTEPESK